MKQREVLASNPYRAINCNTFLQKEKIYFCFLFFAPVQLSLLFSLPPPSTLIDPPSTSMMPLLLYFCVFMSFMVLCTADCAGVCDLPTPLTCNYITYPVYTNGLDLAQVNANTTELLNEAKLLQAILPACYNSIQLFTCLYFYPTCDSNGNRIKPCKDECTTTKTNCQAAYDSVFTDEQKAMLNCDSDFFEQSNTNCARLESNTPIPCNGSIVPEVKAACYDYEPDVAVNTGYLCSPFVSKQIYLETDNATDEQITLDLTLNSIIGVAGQIYPLIPRQCYQNLLSLMCRTFFPTCEIITDPDPDDPTNATNQIYASSLPCKSACEQTNELCEDFFEMINQTVFNCDAPFLGIYPWEEGPTYTTTSNSQHTNVTVTCAADLYASDALATFSFPVVESCPFPMALNTKPSGNDRTCWIPCPDPTYTNSEWDALIAIGRVFGSISFVCMFFMTLTSMLDGKRRKFPANLHICEFVSAMLLPIAYFLGGAHPKEETWCDNPITYATIKTNARCGAQGVFFIFSILAIMLWWLVLSANMFLAVILGKRKQLRTYSWIYYLVGFGVPFALTTTLAVRGQIGYTPPSSWCFITASGFNIQGSGHAAKIGPDYTLFYIPIGVAILLASAMFGAVLFKVVKVRRSTTQMAGSSSVSVRVQARLMIFVAVLLVLFVLIFEWRIVLQNADTGEIKRVDLAWAVCKLKTELGIANPGVCPESRPPLKFNFSHTAFETWLASSLGIFVFLVFGSEKSIYLRWYLMMKLAWNRKWRELVALIKDTAPNSVSSQLESQKKDSKLSRSASAKAESGSASGISTSSATEPLEMVSFEVQDSLEIPRQT